MEKCKTCANGYPSVACTNCGTGFRNYISNELIEIAKKGNLTDCGQRKCADTIEAQQQEIDQLKAQAGRVMRMEEGLKGQRSFLQLLNNLGGLGYEKHGWISDHIKAIDTLLGGKEDEH